MNKLANYRSLFLAMERPLKACLHFLFFGVLLFTYSSTFANSTTNCNVSWTTTNNSITVTGLSAPHVIFKLFTPEWKRQTDCFDNCSDSMTITGLIEGATYHVSYNLYDANWKPICRDLQDVVIEGGKEEISLPDLFLSNLSADASGLPNEVANYSFDLNNLGTSTASGEYIINAYISTDNQLDETDVKVGEVPTGDTPIGTIANVPGLITTPNLPAGNYFLILQADPFGAVSESNETNNSISTPFSILDDTVNTGECGFLKLDIYESDFGTETNVSCNTIEEEDSYTFQCANTWLSIDKEGNFLSATPAPEFAIENPGELDFTLNNTTETFTLSFSGNSRLPAFNKDLTLDPGQGLTVTDIVVSNNRIVYDGFLIVGTLVARPADNSNRFFQYAVKVDVNGNITSAKILGEDVFGDFFFTLSTLYTTQNGYVFQVFQSNLLSLIKFDQQGNFLWKTPFASDLPSNRLVEIDITADEQFAYTANTNNRQAVIDKVNLITGETVYSVRLVDLIGFAGASFLRGIEPTADGGVIVSYVFDDSPTRNISGYAKLDASGNIVWNRRLEAPNDFVPVLETSDGGILFLQSKEGVFSVLKTNAMGEFLSSDCGEEEEDEMTPIACDLSYGFSNSDLSISGSGLNAGHVIVKIFDPSWKTIYSCQDDCGTTINLEGLEDGKYHVNIAMYNSNWQSTCRELVQIELGAAPSRFRAEGTRSITSLKTKSAAAINVYPNPASGLLYVDLNNSLSIETTLQITDQLGRLHISKQIDKDTHTIPVSIEQLKSGLYWLSLVNQDGVITTRKIVVDK